MKIQIASMCLSITALLVFAGCETETATSDDLPPGTHVHADGSVHTDHASHDDPPHDGTVVDWGGGKYHIEFTVDHDKQQATVYILDESVKKDFPIATKEINLSIKDPAFQVTLTASPQESDPEGTSSRFVGNHENLGIVKEYEGTIFGTVDEKPYSGDFKEVPHDHE